jgi:hypothetical protein
MVKTRANNTEDAEKQEDSNITSILREMLEKMNNMQRDIEDLKAKNNAQQDQRLPVGLASENGQQKIPRTPAPTEREHIESPNAETVDQTPKNANFSSFFTAVENQTPKSISLQHTANELTQKEITIIRGENAHYKTQLRTITDLSQVISHLTEFNDWRRRLSSQQLLITTMHRNALKELDLGSLVGSDNMQDSQLIRFIKVYWHSTPPTRTEFFKMLEKISYTDNETSYTELSDSQAIIQSYRSTNAYLYDINTFILAFKEITGMEYQENVINKRNVTNEYPHSTIWQVVESRLMIVAPAWLEIITYEMNFKKIDTWKLIYKKIQEKAEDVMSTYRQHAVLFNGLKTMLKPRKIQQDKNSIHGSYKDSNTNSSSKVLFNTSKRMPSVPSPIPAKLAALGEKEKPLMENFSDSEDDYQRDTTPLVTNTEAMEEEESNLEESNEADLNAITDNTDTRVCYRWLTGICDKGKSCTLPHTTEAAQSHIEKLKIALNKKRTPNLAAIGDGTDGMRMTAWLDLEDGNASHEIQALLDPGSDTHSFISLEMVKTIFTDAENRIIETPAIIRLGGTEKTQSTYGSIWVTITIGKVTATIPMHIFNTKDDVIIGLPHIRQYFLQPTIELLSNKRVTPINFVTALDPIGSLAALTPEALDAELTRLMEEKKQ